MTRRNYRPGEPRSTFALRLGDDERSLLQEAADAAGIPLSQYIRDAALDFASLELLSEDGPEKLARWRDIKERLRNP